MKPHLRYGAFIASLLLVMPLAAYADNGTRNNYASQSLQLQLDTMTCRNTYVTGYLGDVASVIDNATTTSTLTTTDIPKLGTDFSSLQSDASTNNTAQFKTDVNTYNADTKTADLDVKTDVKTTHSKTVNTTLRSDNKQLQSTYQSCLFGVKQQVAQFKANMFNTHIANAQNRAGKLASRGMNTAGLNQTINTANAGVQAFEQAVTNAQNSTQIKAALQSFCLYNGCKTPNNQHFAANTAIQVGQSRLNVLADKNTTSTFQGLVSQAQTDLTNAQTALTQVGSSQYQGNQSDTVWNDIKAASDIMQQLQHMVNHKP
ncbi:MAG: hypothetical protein ACREA8_07745 [Nitrosotalea sp.]